MEGYKNMMTKGEKEDRDGGKRERRFKEEECRKRQKRRKR